VARITRIADDERDYVEPHAMLRALVEDNKDVLSRMRELHGVCDEIGDVATASLLETFIDETERRIWFLYETAVGGEYTNQGPALLLAEHGIAAARDRCDAGIARAGVGQLAGEHDQDVG
jgi:hypothetical protein